jgi:hypothetical protein
MSQTTTTGIMLYASQIAAIIGYNRHKKVSDAMELLWERVAPESFRAALLRTGIETESERVDRLLSARKDVHDMVKESLDGRCRTSVDVASKYEEVSRQVGSLADMCQEDKTLVDATIKRNLFTTYGTAAEHAALEKVRDALGIRAAPDPTFYKAKVATVRAGSVAVWIGGKIDAISEDRKLVIEIKNRIRRLFYFKIPFYEIVQLQCYLQLLGVERGALVECHRGLGGAADINVVPVLRDRRMWEDVVVPKVSAFSTVFLDLLDDPKMQDAFLRAGNRTAYLQARISAAELQQRKKPNPFS